MKQSQNRVAAQGPVYNRGRRVSLQAPVNTITSLKTIPALTGGPSAARGEPEQGPVALKDQTMAAVSADCRKCGGALGQRRNGGRGPCDDLYVEIIPRRGLVAALVPAFSGGTAGDGPQKPGKPVQQISTKKGIDNPGKTCIIHIVADAMRHLKPNAERCRRRSKDRLA